jgi:hypothetical protein
MNDLTIWLTYHDDKQIQEFGLKATEDKQNRQCSYDAGYCTLHSQHSHLS